MILEKQAKKNYIWNTLAGIVNAAEAVIMSMVVTRVTGVIDAGILTISFSIGNLFMCIGKYGVYNYQVTDVKNKYSFQEYFVMRMVTVFFMMLAVSCYLLYGKRILNYEIGKVQCILLICIIYAFESFEDVFFAFYQKHGRLDVGGIIFCVRWILILLFFTFTYIFSKKLSLSLFVACLVGIFVFIFSIIFVFNKMYQNNYGCVFKINKISILPIAQLLKKIFPLFAIAFLSFYVINAPKYAIDKVYGDAIQAYYGFVAMPVFVIGLLNSFIYHPSLVAMGEDWISNNRNSFKKRVARQLLIILLLTIICFFGAMFFGNRVLSWLFNTDISDYMFELLIFQIAGGLLAVSGYLSVVITVMRYQRDLLFGYIVIAIVSLVSMNNITAVYGVRGVVIEYTLLMALLSGIYTINLIYRFIKSNK